MKIYQDITELIGHTPLIEVTGFDGSVSDGTPSARLLVKCEGFNPAGSAKDRVAAEMIADAEKQGKLVPGSVIVEPTSGNTGIGLAAVAAVKGYHVILTMPDSMSAERIKLLAAYGAELVLTPGAQGMAGAIAKAEEIAASTPGSFLAGQFVNPANPAAHYKTTGPEIFEDTYGTVDIFIAGVGTGGTITGTGRYLKEKKPGVKIIGVEPKNSPVLTEGRSGAHGLMGIGAGFVPDILDTDLLDEVIAVTEEEAYAAGRLLGKKKGILVGISAGAALHAALLVAKRPENAGKTIVVLLPDVGDRYLSTPMY